MGEVLSSLLKLSEKERVSFRKVYSYADVIKLYKWGPTAVTYRLT